MRQRQCEVQSRGSNHSSLEREHRAERAHKTWVSVPYVVEHIKRQSHVQLGVTRQLCRDSQVIFSATLRPRAEREGVKSKPAEVATNKKTNSQMQSASSDPIARNVGGETRRDERRILRLEVMERERKKRHGHVYP